MKSKESIKLSVIDNLSHSTYKVDLYVRELLLYSKNASKVLAILMKNTADEWSTWSIWYHFARYQLYHTTEDLKQAYFMIMDLDINTDPWLLHITARYAYEVAGQPIIGLRYLRKAIALRPFLVWQSEYAVLCYYTHRHDESRRYLEKLINVGYHKENSYLFSLYIDLLVRREEFSYILNLYRSYKPRRKLPHRDLVLFFKLEELFGNKKEAQKIAKQLFHDRSLLDDINQAFLLLYFLKEREKAFADKLYHEATSQHSLTILARILYATQYQLHDIYAERQWYQQKFRLYSFIDHSFLLYINSGLSDLHRLAIRLHYQHLGNYEVHLHYCIDDLWQKYGEQLFFLGEKVLLAAQFVRVLYNLQSKQYALADMQLHGIAITYRSRFVFVGSTTMPFGYYLLRAELAARRRQWQLASSYYTKALKKLAILDSFYQEYFPWLLIECAHSLVSIYLQYLTAEQTAKRLSDLDIFDPEHLTFIMHQLDKMKQSERYLEAWIWQAQMDEQLVRRKASMT